MCMYIDPWTISTSDQRVRIQHLSPPLHLARPLQPCRVSLSLFVPISLPSLDPFPFCFRARLLVIIIIHSTLARGAAKVTILLLATSPYAGYVRVYRVSRGICNRLLLSPALPVLSTICLGVLYPRDFQLILNTFLIGVLCYNLHNQSVSLISYASWISKFICICSRWN